MAESPLNTVNKIISAMRVFFGGYLDENATKMGAPITTPNA